MRIIHHPTNLGYGEALRSGFRVAWATAYIGYTDGDAQYDPYDLIVACTAPTQIPRAVLGFKVTRAEGVYRRVQSRLYNALIRRLFGLAARDINCSLKWFPAPAFKRLNLRSRSAFIDAEILLGLSHAGVPFVEVPVQHFARRQGRGRGARPRVILSTLREIYAYLVTPEAVHEVVFL